MAVACPSTPAAISSLLFDNAADPIFILDTGGNFVDVNSAACRHTGYNRDELLQMGPQHLDDAESQLKIPQRLAQLEQQGQATFNAVHVRRDGSRVPVEMHISMIEHEGKKLTLNICRDVSERLQKDIEYQHIVHTTKDGFWIADVHNARFLDVNKAYCDMVGYSREELLAQRIFDMEAIETGEESAAHMGRVLQNGHDFFETQHRHKEGHRVEIEASVSYSSSRGGVFFVFVRDITARKRKEEELKLAASVFNASSAAILVTDEHNKIVSVNPAFTTTTGYAAEEVIGRNPNILSSGKQSKEFYRDMWQSIQLKQHWQGELWDKRKDGEIFAEQLTINVIINKDGGVHRHIAMFSDITEKKQAADVVWRQANYDVVTNLPNRRLFLDRLDQELKKCRRSGSHLAIFFVDLDRFKDVNDAYGHSLGDQLLGETARRLNECVRSSDTVARLGGDEFTLILANLSDPSGVGAVAENILEKLGKPFYLNGVDVRISASIGIAQFPGDALDPESLTDKADIAMYAAKRQGRNRVCFYSERLDITME